MKLPPEFTAALLRPEGHLTLDIDGNQLRQPGYVVFINEISGRQHFRLEKLADGRVLFSHSCPSRKTLDAITHSQAIPADPHVVVEFSWNLKETLMSLKPQSAPQLAVTVVGQESNRQFTVQANGDLFQMGDLGAKVFEAHVIENGKETFLKTAIELWTKTLEVNESLLSIQPPAPVKALAGVTIARLVTGFEVYSKRRFYELQQEGVPLNAPRIIDEFNLRIRVDNRKKKSAARDIKGFETGDLRIVSSGIEQKLVNFQNYQDTSGAFSAAYGLRFSELPEVDPLVTVVIACMKFRHKFTHAKPDTILFSERETGKKHEELTTELARQKQSAFDAFIRKVHQATSELRKK